MYIVLDFAIAVVAYLYFPETRRLTIEEISLVFDYGTKEGREGALRDLEAAREREEAQRAREAAGNDIKEKEETGHIEHREVR